MRNLRATRREDFVKLMTERLRREVAKGRNILRLHQDGDFYSQEYLEKWKTIARNVPEVTIYCYTKSFHLDWSGLPRNMIVIQSYGSKWDHLIDREGNTARVVNSGEEVNEGEFLCPYHRKDFTKCGEYCRYCMERNGKPKHVVFLRH